MFSFKERSPDAGAHELQVHPAFKVLQAARHRGVTLRSRNGENRYGGSVHDSGSEKSALVFPANSRGCVKLKSFGPWRSLASALAWGARGREFESRRPDQGFLRLTAVFGDGPEIAVDVFVDAILQGSKRRGSTPKARSSRTSDRFKQIQYLSCPCGSFLAELPSKSLSWAEGGGCSDRPVPNSESTKYSF